MFIQRLVSLDMTFRKYGHPSRYVVPAALITVICKALDNKVIPK